MKQCKCGSYAFNLYKEDIDQGDLCDVHYWKEKALAQPEQEPYCWTWDEWIGGGRWRAEYGWEKPERQVTNLHPLYTTPPQRTWVGLTDEEVIASSTSSTYMDELDAWVFARDIEAKLKEKNA